MEKINILLIEDEEFDVLRVKKTLALHAEHLKLDEVVSDGNSALKLIKKKFNRFDVVIMDFQIAGGLMGEDLIREIKIISPCIQIIVITKLTINDNKFEFANRLLKMGAFWYCTKYPTHIAEYIYQPTDFLISIHNAYQKKILELNNFEYNRKMTDSINIIMESKKIIGSSQQIKLIGELIQKYAIRDINVLIYGESGTGKELVAYNIHYNSKRRLENFVKINCGSIPNDLIESELFGYEKYAFTGANNSKKGLFEVGNKGTIFLDEIADLPLSAQTKLLRVLQDGEIEKIGRSETIKVDVRILAASNKNLEEEVRAKRFRKDLFYRLNVIPINIPPLRERIEDILVMLKFFVSKYSNSFSLAIPKFTEDAMREIQNYDWPGNARELKSFAQRILFVDSENITREHVLGSLNSFSFNSNDHKEKILDQYFDSESIMPLKKFEKIAKSKYVEFVRKNSTNDSKAAEVLGVAQPNFSRLCKDLNS